MSRPLLLLYNVVYFCGFLVYLPLFLWKMLLDRSYRQGIRERMGHVPARAGGNVLWVHGVSVGEVKAAAPLVAALERALPSVKIVVSSTTPTGRKVACQLFGLERVIYYPLDFWRFPARALERTRPRCVLLVELELWPNFLHAAEQRGIPVAVVNGRISERSFRGYRWVTWLLPQMDRIDLFSVQNETYAGRLRDLGVSPANIRTVGNLKYDSLTIHDCQIEPDAELERLLASGPGEAVVVAGSTHAGEEAQLARAVLRLEERLGRPMRLVVAPRHPERSGAATDDLRAQLGDERAATHPVVRLTEQRARRRGAEPGAWLVVDTIGELEKAYSVADVVFVGGSLVQHGGQNMLEPVALGKPTVLGPNVWNFRMDVDLLQAGDGVLQVEDEHELTEKLAFLLSHPAQARQLVERAQRVLRANQGASERTLQGVLALLAACAPDLLAAGGDQHEAEETRGEREDPVLEPRAD